MNFKKLLGVGIFASLFLVCVFGLATDYNKISRDGLASKSKYSSANNDSQYDENFKRKLQPHRVPVQEDVIHAPKRNYSIDSRTRYIDQNLDEIRDTCVGNSKIIRLNGRRVLCITGEISNGDYEWLNNKSEHFSIAYANSPGGSVLEAIRIGGRIHENRAYLIADDKCYSSCANYLVPSSNKLYVADNTVILQHGSPPRSKSEFRKMMRSSNFNNSKDMDERDKIRKQTDNKFSEYHSKEVVQEIAFFLKVDVNEAYVTRYIEIIRTLENRQRYFCVPELGLGLIVGPKYLEEFNIKIARPWVPKKRSDYLNLVSDLKNTYSLLFDFDDHPFWISGKGAASSSICYD